MLKSPYKIKHWSPVKKVPKSVDPYQNVDTDDWPIYVGEGILAQIKEQYHPYGLTVERLYEVTLKEWWPLLDMLLADREDLQDRIKKIKGGD